MIRGLANLILLTAALTGAAPAVATVLTGPITALPESGGMFWWGDGINDLGHEWSVGYEEYSGWFYGSDHPWSTADVYVYAGLTDPTTISNATVFSYSSDVLWAEEGDTVFFRGTNGYYGAWRIDDIYPGEPGGPLAYLDGQWYFQDDGSGDFTPEPATWGLLAVGTACAARRRRV